VSDGNGVMRVAGWAWSTHATVDCQMAPCGLRGCEWRFFTVDYEVAQCGLRCCEWRFFTVDCEVAQCGL